MSPTNAHRPAQGRQPRAARPGAAAALRTSFITADLAILSAVFHRDVAIARVLGVNSAQLSRWRQGQLPDADNQARVRALADTVRDLAAVLLSPAIVDWMEAPRVRTGESPADLLRANRLEELTALVQETVQGDIYS